MWLEEKLESWLNEEKLKGSTGDGCRVRGNVRMRNGGSVDVN